MNSETIQDTLFEDPIGLRFRQSREKAKLSQESAAQQLKLPVAVIDAIEKEDWSRLGAPIFVRSYVGSYAKLLGLPATLADEVVRGKPAPQLAAIGSGMPSRKALDRSLMNLAYLAMTVVIVGSVVMLAMYFQSPRRSAEVLPLDPPSAYGQASVPAAPGTLAATVDAQPNQVASPVLASLAPSMTLPTPVAGEITLRFRAQSWVELLDSKGVALERGLVAAGSERRYGAGQLGRATLGDSTAVEVIKAGAAVDLTPYREANVVRFTVSSDGTIQAASGG